MDAVITAYVYDGSDILFEYDGASTLLARYTHGPGIDEPLIMDRGGQAYCYHADGLGSVTELTDSAGTVVQAYLYDSYGNIIQMTGVLVNPFTYTGRELDTESGLYFYRARYYDSTTGRFLQEDPIGFLGGSINIYAYVNGNPITFLDPFGFDVQADGEITLTIVAIDYPFPGDLNNGAAEADPFFGPDLVSGVAGICKVAIKQGIKRTAKFLESVKRGLANEKRVLKDMGLTKNHKKVSTAEGNAIPDSLPEGKLIEIKDRICVSCTNQIRIETGAAKASGRESILITGTGTRVTKNAKRAFDKIIKLPGLGPQ